MIEKKPPYRIIARLDALHSFTRDKILLCRTFWGEPVFAYYQGGAGGHSKEPRYMVAFSRTPQKRGIEKALKTWLKENPSADGLDIQTVELALSRLYPTKPKCLKKKKEKADD
jgi:hypothetical protein